MPREVHNIVFTQAIIKEVLQTSPPQVVKRTLADTCFPLNSLELASEVVERAPPILDRPFVFPS